MKKITLCAIALMASATSFAQTTLWNGEDKELGTSGTGVWPRCNPEVVENKDKTGVNTSGRCLKFTITGTSWDNGSTAFGLPTGTSFSSKRLSLKMKKDDNTNVRVELTFKDGENNNVYKKVAAWYDGAGEWRTLYFDFSTNDAPDAPTEIAIYPTTDNFEGSKEVYIDDIRIEELPKVGDISLKDLADGSLSGNIKLSGSWLKGECQNADGDWQKVEYNDFATLNSKLSADVTSVDMRGTVTKDADVAPFFVNPNTIVYADVAYDYKNVVANGNAAKVELTDANAFAIPYKFDATNVLLTRNMREGINSFVLPFYVNPDELGATKLATYKKSEGNKVIFEVKDKTVGVNANIPFITCDVAAEKAGDGKTLNFKNKGFVATPTSFEEAFKGVYAHQSATGLYGIDKNGNLHKGGVDATINAFHAYYLPAVGEAAPATISFDGEATGIDAVTTTSTSANGAVYDLSGRRVAANLAAAKLAKGIYVVNGKKVAVK